MQGRQSAIRIVIGDYTRTALTGWLYKLLSYYLCVLTYAIAFANNEVAKFWKLRSGDGS
ncbi:hypothetical protein NKDENANG_00745 [Candidatus Entotheonellaceae bacterium PAL068K]